MPEALLYIGRFQPFHNGHLRLVEDALTKCQTLVIGVGSTNRPYSEKNPFLYFERVSMILESVSDRSRIFPVPLSDFPHSDIAWAEQVKSIMSNNGFKDWGIYGYEKDASSFYLGLFPGHELHIYTGEVLKINATDIREQLFKNPADVQAVAPSVPKGTLEVLNRLNLTERIQLIRQGA